MLSFASLAMAAQASLLIPSQITWLAVRKAARASSTEPSSIARSPLASQNSVQPSSSHHQHISRCSISPMYRRA